MFYSTQAEFSLKATSVDTRKQTSLKLVSTEVIESGKTLYSYVCTAGENMIRKGDTKIKKNINFCFNFDFFFCFRTNWLLCNKFK